MLGTYKHQCTKSAYAPEHVVILGQLAYIVWPSKEPNSRVSEGPVADATLLHAYREKSDSDTHKAWQ